MNCEQTHTLIEDYIDSALDQKTSTSIKAHLDSCAACASFHKQLSREQEIYAGYQRDVEITPALWASIESRIKQDPVVRPEGFFARLRGQMSGLFAAPRLSPGFAAALVLVAIGLTIGVMSYLNSRGQGTMVAGNINTGNGNTTVQPDQTGKPADPNPTPVKPNQPEIAQNVPSVKESPVTQPKVVKAAPQKQLASSAGLTPTQLVREAEQKYLTAISMLSRDMNKNRSKLDPIMLARFDASLSDIDRTIKETRRVVRENPGDPIALQYLLAAYSKKVEVLRGMTTD